MLQVTRGAHGITGETLQERIYQISPEHAAKLSDWKNMKYLTSRVVPEVYSRLEQFMTTHGLSEPVFPQTWLRDATFLLAPRGQGAKAPLAAAAGVSPEEQLWICRRLLALVERRAREADLTLGGRLSPG